MPIVINFDEIENRIKQGLAAGAGTFAMVTVAAFRISHERDMVVSPSSVFKFSAVSSAIAGSVWASMPGAKETPVESLEHAKEQLYPALKVGLGRMLENEHLLDGVRDRETPSYAKPSYSYGDGNFDDLRNWAGSSSAASERRRRRLDRAFGRAETGFDSDYEDNRDVPVDDFLTDDEYDEILREELETDPFYEGPGSIFDKL